MKLNIHGDKVEVTESIKSHIESKLEKLNHYFENSEEMEAKVVIRVRGINQIIEVTILTKKFTLRAEETHTDLYASADLVVDKLEKQIRKNKTRINKFKVKEEFDFITDFEDIDEENIEQIVKRKKIESKPMDEEEAILQMELLNHNFFVFKNIDEDCVSVIYLRKDGSYGIIDMK